MNRKTNFCIQSPSVTSFSNPKSVRSIEFIDRHNTEYEVVNKVVNKIGKTKSYKDYIAENLNPKVNNDGLVYGVAKKYEPKTNTINRNKELMDSYLNLYNSSIMEYSKSVVERDLKTESINNGGETNVE